MSWPGLKVGVGNRSYCGLAVAHDSEYLFLVDSSAELNHSFFVNDLRRSVDGSQFSSMDFPTACRSDSDLPGSLVSSRLIPHHHSCT